ncbi:MAG TPA: translocation/assembly module TamB domain-containing protein [Polyangiaceae bacterium]|nr:translocation/assembly module TamB domain-containing protein [Polyangiaceae bacterium]
MLNVPSPPPPAEGAPTGPRGDERPRRRGLGRLRRALAVLGSGLGLTLVFASATATGAAIHLNTPSARRAVSSVVNTALKDVLLGQIVVGEINYISLLKGLDIQSAKVLDPSGKQVIQANGIVARVSALGIVKSVLFGRETHIDLPYIRIDHVDALIQEENGELTVARAFEPKPAKEPPKTPSEPATPFYLTISRFELNHAWAHGEVAPPTAIDTDVSRVAGSLHVTPDEVALDVEQAGIVERRITPLTTSGVADFHLRAGKTVKLWTDFEGMLGEIQVNAHFLMDDDRIEAKADVPRAPAAAVSQLVPGYPLLHPVTVKVRAEGTFETLEVDANAVVESGDPAPTTVDVAGNIAITDSVKIEAAILTKNVDPRIFGADLPEAKLSAQASAKIELGDRVRVVAFAQTDPAVLAGQVIPAVDAHAVVDDDLVSGSVEIHEEGAPLSGWFDVLPDGTVRFKVGAEIASIRGVPRIAAPVDGSARVAVTGTVKEGALDARVNASLAGIRAPGDVELASAAVTGHVQGPFEALKVNAGVTGTSLRAGSYFFDSVNVQASGPVTSPYIRTSLASGEDEKISVSGMVDAEGGGARNVKLRIEQKGKVLDGSVARVGATAGGVAINGITIKGDGIDGIEGSLALQGGEIVGKLRGEGIDAKRVAELAGLPIRMSGLVAFDVAIDKTRKGRKGHIHLAMENGEAAVVEGLSTMMSVTFDDDKVRADGFVRLIDQPKPNERIEERCDGSIARISLNGGEGVLKGPLLEPKTWMTATGSVDFAAEDLDLRCLARRVPGGIPLSSIGGKLTTRFRVERQPGERLASVRDLVVRTKALAVAGPEDPETEKPAWESRSVDFELTGGLDSQTGKTEVKLSVLDPNPLLEVSSSTELDLKTLIDRPQAMNASLRKTPFQMHVAIPRRSVTSFASIPFVKENMPPIVGDVRVDAFVNGTATEPRLALRVLGWDLAHQDALASTPDASDFRIPVNLDLLATYDSEKATLETHVTKDGRELILATGEVKAKLSELLAGKPADPRKPLWTGSLEAKLFDLPLGQIPVLANNDVGGHIGGTIAVKGLNEAPSVAIDLELPDIQIGRDYFFDRGRISLHIDPRKEALPNAPPAPALALIHAKNTAVAQVELVGQDGGTLRASAYAGIHWENNVVPTVDPDSAADFLLSARKFRLTALQPAVAGVLSKIDGFLNGDVRVGFNRAGEGEKGKIEADMAVTQGVVYVPQLGQEFQDAKVRIIATKEGVLRLDDLSATASSGRVGGWALARFDGLVFQDAAGELTIGDTEPLPLALEGVPLGRLSGKVALTAKKTKEALTASVRIPGVRLELPASIGRNVQPLDENEEIVTSHPLDKPEEEVRAENAQKVILNIDLDRADIKGPMVDVALKTSDQNPLRIELTDKTRIFGDIETISGRLDVMGKEFDIERVLVHMRGQDEPNPYVNATVRWDAPDGSRVFIDFIGSVDPITEEKIRFRSDPTRSKQEIIGLLLLGSDYEHGTVAGGPSGESKEPTRSTGNAAGGMAAGFVADQFSGLLADSGISTSVGTTEEGALKTGLVYEKGTTRTQVTYEGAGSGAAGSPRSAGGGSQRQGRTEVSVDWRFQRNWLLRGMVGVGGDQPSSGLDLLWQYRY